MGCQTALVLFADYVRAADAFISATDNLSVPIADPKLQDIAALSKECEKTRLALENHWAEHHCRVVAKTAGL